VTRAASIDIERAVALLRVLANPSRLRITLRLLTGEVSVAALESGLSLRQPNLSQHLGELREAGLVIARRESRAVFYRLAEVAQGVRVHGLLEGLGAPVQTAPSPQRGVPLNGRGARQAAVFAIVQEAS
jgi:DNA-binding transcriptional ArsR family regulator